MELRRIALGLGATAYTTVGTLGVQFLSVPILIWVWGFEGYGSWLLLSTIPTALLLVDAGLAGVAGNRMAARLGAGEREAALVSFSTLWVTVTAAATIVVALAVVAIGLAPARLFPTNATVGVADARAAAVALALYTGVVLQMDVGAGVGFRATGRYAEGAAIAGTTQIAERVAVLAAAWATGSLAAAAAALAVTRLVGAVALIGRYRRTTPDLLPRRDRWSAAELRALAGPAAGVLLLPVAFAISLQGPLLLIGLTGSQATVGLFGAVRTFTRFALQLVNMVSTVLLPEFAIACGHADNRARNEVFGLNLILGAGLTAALMVGFVLFGRVGLGLWLPGGGHGGVGPLLLVLAAGTLVNGFWNGQANMLLAANRPRLYTPTFLLVTAASLAVAAWPASAGDPVGVAAVILAAELVMLIHVARMGRRLSIDGYRPALAAAAERLRQVASSRPGLGWGSGHWTDAR